MSRTADRVRCYDCGRLGPRSAGGCARCSASFGALCDCGAELSVFDDECPKCGVGHVPRRCPAAKLPRVRALKWTALCLAVGAVAWMAFAPREKLPWQLKAEGKAAYNAGDYDAAVRDFLRVTEETPGDAEGWYYLARSYQAGKVMSPEQCAEVVRHALTTSPDYFQARDMLAHIELELGHLDRAIEHAEAAAHSPSAGGDAWLLLARLELRKPQPSLAAAQDALEHARSAGRDTTEVKALLAEVTIRLHGALAGGADRLPARGAATLRAALSALDPMTARDDQKATVAMTRARIQLALGEFVEAIKSTDYALAHLPADASIETSAEIRLVGAMALHASGRPVPAMDAFAVVLRDRPDAATAAAASSYLTAAGHPDSARALLSHSAEAHDPKGAVHAVLATLLLQQGDVEGAARAIESARAASADDSFFAEIMGSVRIEQRRFADARSAFADAIRSAPALVGPHVRLALVVLAERAAAAPARNAEEDAKAREVTAAAYEQALRDLDELRTKFGNDPFLLEGIGRLDLAIGNVAAARAALESASAKWPADPDIWIALAEARRRTGATGESDAIAGAAAALGRARVLRPDDPAIALAEAQAWTDAGKYDVAVAACSEFLRRHGDDPAVLRARAISYGRLEMWSLEANDLRRLKDLGKAGESDVSALVNALFCAGDAKAARQAADDAKSSVSEGVARYLDFLTTLHGGDAKAAVARLAEGRPTLLLAEIQLAAGQGDESIATLRKLLVEQPGNPWVARLFVAELLGPDTAGEKEIAEARALLAALVPGSPKEIVRLVEGRILLAEKRNADAIAALRDAVHGLPSDPLAALFLGEALFRTGERTESLAAMRRAVTLPAAPPSVRSIVANRLLTASGEKRDLELAESLAREAMRLDPSLLGAAYRTIDLLHARGEFAEAADVAEHAMQFPGRAPGDLLKLRLAAATEHLIAGEFPAVEVHVDALPPEVRESADGKVLMGFAELGAGRTDSAARIFDTLLAADAGNSVASTGLVQVALKRGDRAAAAARVDAWNAAHPADRDATLGASRLFLRAGFPDDAARLAALCAERHPLDFALALNLADVLRRAGRFAEALDALRRFAASAPPDRAVEARLAVAALAVRCGGATAESLDTARKVADDPASSDLARMEAAVIEAEALLADGRLADAEAAARAVRDRLAEAAVKGRPERMIEARAHFVIGYAAASASPPRRAQAMDEFSSCMVLDPSNLDVVNNLASVMAEDPDTASRALELSRHLVSVAPENAHYWATHAEAARRAGEPQQAEAAYSRVVDLLLAAKPREPARLAGAGLNFARFLKERKNPAAAHAVAEKVRAALAGTGAEREIEKFLAE